jgi:hypothetical protein
MEEDWRLPSEEPEGAEAAGVKEEAVQAKAMGVAPTRGTREPKEKLRAPQAGEAPQGQTTRERATATTVAKKDTGPEIARIYPPNNKNSCTLP